MVKNRHTSEGMQGESPLLLGKGFPKIVQNLELHPGGPEDVLANQIAISRRGVIEEGSVPLLVYLHGQS